jgi:hypothetical protein
VAVHCERHDYEVFFSVGNLRVFKHSSLSHEHAMAQLINRYPPEVSR